MSLIHTFVWAFAGVGKSSLVHLLCQNQVLGNPSWTVGCSVDVRVSETHKTHTEHNIECTQTAAWSQ